MDEHSLQSPFLFKMYQSALNSSRREKIRHDEVELLRKKLLSDHRSIQLNYFGSGSSLDLTKSKQIRSIAKAGISSSQQSEVLVNLIHEQGSKTILELGTSLGLNTIYLSKAIGVKQITTVEGNAELCEIAKDHFAVLEAQNIELVNRDIDAFFHQIDVKFDFIYMDANHTYDATKRYFTLAMEHLSQTGIIVLDDINWSTGMTQAWKELRVEHPNHLYVENDKIGIVFVNVDTVKKHYILRF